MRMAEGKRNGRIYKKSDYTNALFEALKLSAQNGQVTCNPTLTVLKKMRKGASNEHAYYLPIGVHSDSPVYLCSQSPRRGVRARCLWLSFIFFESYKHYPWNNRVEFQYIHNRNDKKMLGGFSIVLQQKNNRYTNVQRQRQAIVPITKKSGW